MSAAPQKYVIYRRVSTSKQDLGLDAQDRDIALFLDHYSDVPYEVIGTFTDKLSGADAHRPALQDAMALAREHRAELLVSKLDRLSRDVEFVAKVLKNKDFRLRVASMPSADTFQLHIYAALAEQERTFISIRTKQALVAAKERGVKLGGDRGGLEERNNAARQAADAAAHRVASIILPMRRSNATLAQIADALNAADVPTPKGSKVGTDEREERPEALGGYARIGALGRVSGPNGQATPQARVSGSTAQ